MYQLPIRVEFHIIMGVVLIFRHALRVVRNPHVQILDTPLPSIAQLIDSLPLENGNRSLIVALIFKYNCN